MINIVTKALGAVTELCTKYQERLQTEAHSLTATQAELQNRMKAGEKLAVSVLKTTRMRVDRLEAETAGLKGGTAVDCLAEATEAAHAILTSIISTLLAIDEMLPPQDRLSPQNSAHKNHYPQLNGLLASKAAELNLCFGSARLNKQRPSASASLSESEHGGPSVNQSFECSIGSPPLHRRISSSSQILLSASADRSVSSSSSSRAPVPQLQLKTVLPSAGIESPKVVESTNGSYFPLASQTATGVSLTHSSGKSSGSNTGSPAPLRRSSAHWGKRPSTGTLAFLPISEGDSFATVMSKVLPPKLPNRSLNWTRRSVDWSGFGGLFGGNNSWGSKEQGRTETAQDKLKMLLENTDVATPDGSSRKAKGKGKQKMSAGTHGL
jgi:hypothetical protein